MKELTPERRRRLNFRALPAVAGLSVLALVGGIMVGAGAPSSAERAARLHAGLAARGPRRDVRDARLALARAWSRRAFRPRVRARGATATVIGCRRASRRESGTARCSCPWSCDARVRRFAAGCSCRWPTAASPGTRDSRSPASPRATPPRGGAAPRAGVAARPRRRGAGRGAGDGRSSPLGGAGRVDRRARSSPDGPRRRARGPLPARLPARRPVGANGLERAFELQLAGRPGGELLAGGRVLARTEPRGARPVRTTIDTGLQQAAVAALAGRLGGIAALDPRTGEIRALAGIAFSAPQPPGSTFKIVTATAALEAGAVRPRTPFPVETAAVDRRGAARERERRVLRRQLPGQLRPLLQLGVRAARA